MPYRRLFIWVEGPDDVRFFEAVVKPIFDEQYDFVVIRPYSGEKPEKISNFLKSIKAMDADYLFVTDINSHPCVTSRKERKLQKYQNLDTERLVVVVKEVESWYLAGLDSSNSKRLGIPPLANTNTLTKEQFDELVPRKKFDSRTDFMLETLKWFSIEVAKGKNQSFAYFARKHFILKTDCSG